MTARRYITRGRRSAEQRGGRARNPSAGGCHPVPPRWLRRSRTPSKALAHRVLPVSHGRWIHRWIQRADEVRNNRCLDRASFRRGMRDVVARRRRGAATLPGQCDDEARDAAVLVRRCDRAPRCDCFATGPCLGRGSGRSIDTQACARGHAGDELESSLGRRFSAKGRLDLDAVAATRPWWRRSVDQEVPMLVLGSRFSVLRSRLSFLV